MRPWNWGALTVRDSLATVATFADPIEAILAKNNLEAAGIPAFLANEEIVDMVWHFGNAIGWIKLQVGNDDADVARGFLGQGNNSATSERGTSLWTIHLRPPNRRGFPSVVVEDGNR